MDPKRVAALFRRVKNDPNLRKICELAGRFRRVAQSKQRTKAVHGMDDLVGVEPNGDIGRLLPVELAKLAVPELELDTLRRLVERQTLCREYQSVEPAARGPIIVAIDESRLDDGRQGQHREGHRPGPRVGRSPAEAAGWGSWPTPATRASGSWLCRPAAGTRRR